MVISSDKGRKEHFFSTAPSAAQTSFCGLPDRLEANLSASLSRLQDLVVTAKEFFFSATPDFTSSPACSALFLQVPCPLKCVFFHPVTLTFLASVIPTNLPFILSSSLCSSHTGILACFQMYRNIAIDDPLSLLFSMSGTFSQMCLACPQAPSGLF